MLKRTIEIAASLLLLIILSPLLAVIALAIKLNSRGPMVFRQERLGRNGKTFTIYKFRTMFIETDPLSVSPSTLEDERITAAGKICRKYKLDELPQIFNIFIGDMSFIGPRPQLAIEMKGLEEQLPELCQKRLLVRPGLSCPWAIIEEKDKTLPTPEMLEADCKYVDQQSLWGDAVIAWQTIKYVLKKMKGPAGQGA